MKTEKIKRYRLGVSRTFPTTHPKKGQETEFVGKITNLLMRNGIAKALGGEVVIQWNDSKIHTIRANYPLWAKRMAEVQAGRAIIELFYWEGKPYNSKHIVFAVLDKNSGCGVQELFFEECNILAPIACEENWYKGLTLEELAQNDGLNPDDFKAWFKGYDLSKPMAIIHFTSFRY